MKTDFSEKTLASAAEYLKNVYFSEYYARLNGFLQKTDPTLKLISLILLLIIVSFSRTHFIIGAFILLLLIFAKLSQIPTKKFIGKIILFVTIPALFLYLPSALNIFSNGKTAIFQITQDIVLTKEGVNSVILNILRITASLTGVIIFNLTTKFSDLIKGLNKLGMSKSLTTIINLCYLNVFVFVKQITQNQQALKSRIIFPQRINKKYDIIILQILNLLRKTINTTNLTHKAMLSRGYGINEHI